MGAELFIGTPECDKKCPLTYISYVKMKLVSMATHNAMGVPTKSTICQLLLNLKY